MRLDDHTRGLREAGRTALAPFLTAGYPDDAAFRALLRGVDAAGADVIEVGVPFSDPIADGPAIQAASRAALDAGASLGRALEAVADAAPDLRAAVVVMTYVNPVLRMGPAAFAREAAAAGAAGVILPDVPIEEAPPLRDALAAEGLALVPMAAPTTPDDRLTRIAAGAAGFLYLVSVTGVTGARPGPPPDLPAFAARARSAAGDRPVYVGFGVGDPEHARRVAEVADGVIVGSRLVRAVTEHPDDPVGAVGALVRAFRRALD